MATERHLRPSETLFNDATPVHALYVLLDGAIILEKEVDIERENFWPIKHKGWQSTAVVRRVKYTVAEVRGVNLIGEKLMVRGECYTVSGVC